jgi:hypothetical protein
VDDELNDDLDEQEDQNEEDVEDQDESSEDESDKSEDDSEESASKSKPDKSEKRIRDLQSALDKAIAENNKLKKATPTDKKAPSRDPEVERWMRAAQDATRDRLYDSDPRFKEFGIDPAVISGDTPEEMRASVKELTKLISRVETRVRNKTLREHGFSPPPKEGGAEPRRSVAGMSNEEFEKLVAEVSVG